MRRTSLPMLPMPQGRHGSRAVEHSPPRDPGEPAARACPVGRPRERDRSPTATTAGTQRAGAAILGEVTWPVDRDGVVAEQQRIARLRPPPWQPGAPPLTVAAVVAVPGGGAGDRPSSPERGWAAAVLLAGERIAGTGLAAGVLPAPYVASLQAAREGPLLAEAVAGLPARPDVLLVAAAGRDHPRGAGLALHLGAVLDLPSVGVTDRPLLARGAPPADRRGDTSPLLLDGEEVGCWVRTRLGVRPVVAHAAWRTTAGVAAAVVLAATAGFRTPAALRAARRLAREARSRG
jgi:deoxyribonuclease V